SACGRTEKKTTRHFWQRHCSRCGLISPARVVSSRSGNFSLGFVTRSDGCWHLGQRGGRFSDGRTWLSAAACSYKRNAASSSPKRQAMSSRSVKVTRWSWYASLNIRSNACPARSSHHSRSASRSFRRKNDRPSMAAPPKTRRIVRSCPGIMLPGKTRRRNGNTPCLHLSLESATFTRYNLKGLIQGHA